MNWAVACPAFMAKMKRVGYCRHVVVCPSCGFVASAIAGNDLPIVEEKLAEALTDHWTWMHRVEGLAS